MEITTDPTPAVLDEHPAAACSRPAGGRPIAEVETDWGWAQRGLPDDLVPADIRADIDTAALQPGGASATLLRLPDGRRLGDRFASQPIGSEHAMGFMQILPST